MSEVIDMDQMDLFDSPVVKELSKSLDEFMDAMEVSRDPELWKRLMKEELREVREAGAALLKELVDVEYVAAGLSKVGGTLTMDDLDDDLKAAAMFHGAIVQAVASDAFIDAIKRVHASNMSKLGDDGKPVRRADGKIMKGPNYKPADLLDLIQ